MIKNNKGITIITLVITIVVLMIIFSIVTEKGFTASRQAKVYNAISQMRAMQAKVNDIYEDYINADDDTKKQIEEYGSDIESIGKMDASKIAYDDVKANNITGEEIGNLEDYRFYSIDYIKNTLDTEGISYDFIINIKTRTVILLDGIKRNEKTYYALCEIENQQYNVNYEKE